MSRAATIAEQERREQRLVEELEDGWPDLPSTSYPHPTLVKLLTLLEALMLEDEVRHTELLRANSLRMWENTGFPTCYPQNDSGMIP